MNISSTRAKQDKKSSYRVDWQQKSIWYGLVKPGNRLSRNIQDIWRSHKVYRENHGKLEKGIDHRRKKFIRSKIPERYLPGRCAITITICNIDEATQSHTYGCTGGSKLTKSPEKINHRIYMDDIKVFVKNEKDLETFIQAVRIYIQDKGMEFSTKNAPC